MAVSGVIVCAVFLFLMLLPIMTPSWAYYVIFSVLLFCCLLSLFLNRRGYLVLASHLLLLSTSLAIFGVILGGIWDEQVVGFVIYYFPLTVLAAGVVLGSRATYGFATLNMMLIVVISVVAYAVLPLDGMAFAAEVLGVSIPAGILCYLMALVAWLYGSSLENALHQVTEYSADLEAANQEIRAFSHTLEEKVEARTHELREFVSMVAHELRGPLTVIRGYTELLQEEQQAELEPRSQSPADLIAGNVEQMLHLTDDLLELSRLRSGGVQFRMEPLAIEAVIDEVCTSYGPRIAEKRLGLKIDLPPDLPKVQGDPFYLNHALSNLVDNAYRYTPAGAIIVGARHVDGSVEVSVSDTGIGISAEEQGRLFRQFIRGEHEAVRNQKGTGLGLSIAHSIVEAHGGEIWVDSRVDKGSTFCFTVPVAAELVS